MDPRFEARRQAILDSAVCPPSLAAEVVPPLDAFLPPFAQSPTEPEQRTHTRECVPGLVSSPASKTGEGIAHLRDHDRQGLRTFMGQVPRVHKPLPITLATRVGQRIGDAEAVPVFDPSGFPEKGPKSVGVPRQWCGRLGKTDNGPVGVFLGACRVGTKPGRTSGCTGPRSGRATGIAARKPGFRSGRRSARDTTRLGRCSTGTARRCRTGGSAATT